MAGKLAVEGAVPLQFNGYKIPLMRNLVKRAICRRGQPSSTGTLAEDKAHRRRHAAANSVGDKSVGQVGPDP